METYVKAVIYVLTGIVGLCVGSFLNVVIYRLPRNMKLTKPASHCTVCDYTLRWYDNIPVLSYIILGGRCRKCRERISFRYTVVELLNMLLWLACVAVFGYGDWQSILTSVCAALASSVCICIAFIDLEHKIIFDRFQIMTAILAIAFTIGDRSVEWWSHLVGAAAGGIIFLLVGYLVSRRVGRDALGGGDVKFAFVTGLFLGWEKFIIMMIVASFAACIAIGISRAGANKKEREEKKSEAQKGLLSIIAEAEAKAAEATESQNEIKSEESKDGVEENDNGEDGDDDDGPKEYPFGPFLASGFMFALLLGTTIINAYLHILGMR